MKFNRDTKLILSVSSAPGNLGTSLYNHLFENLNFNGVYLSRYAVNAEGVADSIRTLGLHGCSVSMPMKSAIIEFLDELDEVAASAQSVNTILNIKGRLKGYNTDSDGFIKALGKNSFNKIVIYGYGSVTKTIVAVLKLHGWQNIFVTGRELDKSKSFANENSVSVLKEEDVEKIDLLVNSTPSGDSPSSELVQLVNHSACVFDLKATPEKVMLLQLAESQGKRIISGFEMFKHQMIAQFHLYTGLTLELDTLNKAIQELDI